MRLPATVIAIFLCAAAAVSCSKAPMPTGRWEGTYESADTLVAARLQIDPGGAVFVSAPDATVPAGDRANLVAVQDSLVRGLADSWGAAQPRKMDFDGKTFRNPGGVAPQMEWDPGTKAMTLVLYLGTRPALRVPMHSVKDFSADPWNP